MGFLALIVAPFTVLVSERQPFWAVPLVLLALLCLVVWLGKRGWTDKEEVSMAALFAYGGTFAFHLVGSAGGEGGWSLFDERNLLLYCWAFVAWVGFTGARINRREPGTVSKA